MHYDNGTPLTLPGVLGLHPPNKPHGRLESKLAAMKNHTRYPGPHLGELYKPRFFPQTGLPVGFYLRKKVTGHAGGRAGLGWARIWPCWARDVAVLGALGWVGHGVWVRWAPRAGCAWRAGRAGLGWAWGLAVLVLGWVGRGFWLLRFCAIVAETNVTVFCSLSAFRHQYA